MVLSTTTPRFHLRSSNMRVGYVIPIGDLDGYWIQSTAIVVFDLNVICTLVNYAAQNIILIMKLQRSIEDYPNSLDWITFAAAIISTIGTVSSLIKNKNRLPYKGRWFNFLISLLLVASTGYALAVHSDPRIWASVLSNLLLYVTRENSKYKEKYYLLGDRRVPIAGFRVQGDVITAVVLSAEHAHVVDSLYQGGRNVALLVSSRDGVRTNLNMREELT